MKKLISLFVIFAVLLGVCVFSAGNYVLATDIVAYIDGYPISSYNIDGNMAVVAEDLDAYGFDVVWSSQSRTLTVNRNINKAVTGGNYQPTSLAVKVGTPLMPIYDTDIRTYLGSSLARSCNVGGKTIIFLDDLNTAFGKNYKWDDQSKTLSLDLADSSAAKPLPDVPRALPSGSSFEIHYIDVGQADAALVICDGHAMLIDGGNAGDSQLIYSYLKKLSVSHLDCIVATHAHEDHVGGLAGALNYATVDTVYCPVTSYDTRTFESFVRYLNQQGKQIMVPKAGDTFTLGSADVQIVGPVNYSDNENNTSIVLRIQYGDTSFLFTGDAEREEELDIIEAGYNIESTVLKVGHHGSNTSTSYYFLYEVNPQYAVISVGLYNGYGHPTEEVLSRLRDADVVTYRTDMQGDIICTSDGKTVSFRTEKNSNVDTLEEVGDNSQTVTRQMPAEETYVLNTNTHKFHYPECSSVGRMSEKNRQYYTGTREEIIAMGYEPCKNCNP